MALIDTVLSSRSPLRIALTCQKVPSHISAPTHVSAEKPNQSQSAIPTAPHTSWLPIMTSSHALRTRSPEFVPTPRSASTASRQLLRRRGRLCATRRRAETGCSKERRRRKPQAPPRGRRRRRRIDLRCAWSSLGASRNPCGILLYAQAHDAREQRVRKGPVKCKTKVALRPPKWSEGTFHAFISTDGGKMPMWSLKAA